ncbi:phosphodiester glycosidase family protein [Luteolibacter sp. LG18]|uniref:phosphodiester glycosidase family protein n=1 Tax=Luteolibacter sp. LG18 TaxID=2819286 RepID=UPI002B312053|nr:hypothetical protein llg_45840 [Luteolibacter sp. LG18]
MLPRILLLLATAAIAHGGEYFRFDAKTAPGGREGTCHGFLFDEKREMVRVVDRDKPATTQGQTLGDAFAAIGAVAGCCAGVTSPDGKPVGLVVSDTKQISPLDTGVNAGAVAVLRAGRLSVMKASAVSLDQGVVVQAIQAGPLVVDGGQPAAGLDTKIFARRNVLLSSGSGQWAIVYVPSATLDGLARMLADKTIFPKFPIQQAMLLSTGLESSLWVARSESALALYLKEVNPVRSGLAIVPIPDKPK